MHRSESDKLQHIRTFQARANKVMDFNAHTFPIQQSFKDTPQTIACIESTNPPSVLRLNVSHIKRPPHLRIHILRQGQCVREE